MRRLSDSIIQIDRLSNAVSGVAMNAFRGIVAATAPAVVSLGAAAAYAAGSFSAMAVSAGAAGGAFGVVLIAAAKRALDLKEAGEQLNGAQRRFVASTEALTGAWNRFLDRTSGQTLGPATTAVNALRSAISFLPGVINAVHPIAQRVADAFARWVQAENGLKRFVAVIIEHGVPALSHLERAGRNVLAFLGAGFRAFAPEGVKMAQVIERGSLALRRWGESGGFQRFIADVKANGPQVRAFFDALGQALANVARALAGMAPVALNLSTALLRVVASLPVGAIQALIYAYTAWKLATAAVAAGNVVLAASHAVLGASVVRTRIATVAMAALHGVMRVGTLAWAAATRVLSLALVSTPVGLIITGLVALGAAIVFIATKTTWFQTAWKYTWNAVKAVAQAVWDFLGGRWKWLVALLGPVGWLLLLARNWSSVWGGIRSVFTAVTGALSTAWRATTNGLATAARWVGGAVRTAFNGLLTAIRAVGDAARWLNERVFAPAMRGIVSAAQWVGRSGRAAFNGLVSALRWVGDGVVWLHRKAFEVAMRGIVAAARWVGSVARSAFGGLMSAFEWVAGGVRWLYRSAVQPSLEAVIAAARWVGRTARSAFNGLMNTFEWVAAGARWLYRSAIQPSFEAVIAAARWVGRTARSAFNGLMSAFEWVAAGVRWLYRSAVQPSLEAVIAAVRWVSRVGRSAFNGFMNALEWVAAGARWLYRAAVQPSFEAVIAAARWVGRTARSAFGGLMNAFEWVAAGVRWLYRAAVRPSLEAVIAAARWVSRVARAAFNGFNNALEWVGAGARWLYRSAVRPSFEAVIAATRWVSRTARSAFRGFMNAIEWVAGGARWLNGRVIQPAWRAVVAATRWLSRTARSAFSGLMSTFEWVAGGARWLNSRVIQPAWRAIVGATRWLRDRARDAFDGMMDGLRTLARAFVNARDGIKRTWDKLGEIVAKPVRFFVNTVYDGGLRKAWNATVAKVPGIPELPSARVNFAHGGKVPGSGGAMQDNVPINASSGEYIINRRSVRMLGIPFLDALNRRRGRAALTNSNPGRPVPGFQLGGLIPDIAGLIRRVTGAAQEGESGGLRGFVENIPVVGGVASKAFDWATGFFSMAADKVIDTLFKPFEKMMEHLPGLKDSGMFGKALQGMVKQAFQTLKDTILGSAGGEGGGYMPFRKWRAGDEERVRFRGHTFNKRTVEMLKLAEKLANKTFQYFQGSFSNARASAGTHTGGGAVDIGPPTNAIVGAMRSAGFAAWARTKQEGFMPHIHGIAVGDPTASPAAKQQVKDFFAGLNGLANRGPDTYVPAGIAGLKGGSGVARWRSLAAKALQMAGLNPNQLGRFMALMQAESGGNPLAINRTDINARNGIPSQGLMQVIPPTFRAYHVAGTSTNILDPLANMAAAAAYIKARYGGNVPGSPYRLGGLVTSFDSGGMLPPGLTLAYNGTGRPEPVGETGRHYHFDFRNATFSGGRKDFENMVVSAITEAERKGRIKAGARRRG